MLLSLKMEDRSGESSWNGCFPKKEPPLLTLCLQCSETNLDFKKNNAMLFFQATTFVALFFSDNRKPIQG